MISIASMTAGPLGQHGLQDSRAGRCIVLAGAVFWLGSGSGSGKGNYMAVAEAGTGRAPMPGSGQVPGYYVWYYLSGVGRALLRRICLKIMAETSKYFGAKKTADSTEVSIQVHT